MYLARLLVSRSKIHKSYDSVHNHVRLGGRFSIKIREIAVHGLCTICRLDPAVMPERSRVSQSEIARISGQSEAVLYMQTTMFNPHSAWSRIHIRQPRAS